MNDGQAYARNKSGRFVDEIEAALAYDEVAIKLHGEFASVNWPK